MFQLEIMNYIDSHPHILERLLILRPKMERVPMKSLVVSNVFILK